MCRGVKGPNERPNSQPLPGARFLISLGFLPPRRRIIDACPDASEQQDGLLSLVQTFFLQSARSGRFDTIQGETRDHIRGLSRELAAGRISGRRHFCDRTLSASASRRPSVGSSCLIGRRRSSGLSRAARSQLFDTYPHLRPHHLCSAYYSVSPEAASPKIPPGLAIRLAISIPVCSQSRKTHPFSLKPNSVSTHQPCTAMCRALRSPCSASIVGSPTSMISGIISFWSLSFHPATIAFQDPVQHPCSGLSACVRPCQGDCQTCPFLISVVMFGRGSLVAVHLGSLVFRSIRHLHGHALFATRLRGHFVNLGKGMISNRTQARQLIPGPGPS